MNKYKNQRLTTIYTQNIPLGTRIALRECMENVNEIHITRGSELCILDDDALVLDVWKAFLSHYSDLQINYFSKASDFINYVQASAGEKQNQFFLIDYNLKDNLNGLDIVEKLKLSKSSLLVTGQYDDTKIQERAKNLGISILPKMDIVNLKISICEDGEI